MNFSRAYSVAHDALFSVGRVQTPTLALVVARELEINAFVPEDYFEILARFRAHARDASAGAPPRAGEPATTGEYRGVYLDPAIARPRTPARLPPDGEEAARIVRRVESGVARVEAVERESHALPPPRLYDLTELQRHANRLYGLSAQRTLDVAQGLYEKKKLLSYPRTDSQRHLSKESSSRRPSHLRSSRRDRRPLPRRPRPRDRIPPARSPLRRRRRGVRSPRHPAHDPEGELGHAHPTPDERRIYDLVYPGRLLSAWHADHLYATTTVVTSVAPPPRAKGRGRSVRLRRYLHRARRMEGARREDDAA